MTKTDETDEGKNHAQKFLLTPLPDAMQMVTEDIQAIGASRMINLQPAYSSKIGRRVFRPCDSGKKIKKCYGALGKVVH